MKINNYNKSKIKSTFKSKKKQVLIVAQEIKFARLLSDNDKKKRDRVLKAFKKWLFNCFEKGYGFKEEDFIRIWKGLFYAVWMTDKPLVQEELCESIAGILDVFPVERLESAMLMTKAGLRVIATEWFGLDHHRMDKFLMLVRRYLRGALRCLQRCQWSLESCRAFEAVLSQPDGVLSVRTPLYARNATSMILHLLDCYLEEIAKVSLGRIPADSLCELLRPVCQYVCLGQSGVLCAAARRVLTALLRQSESGLSYRHRTQAWQRMGCPGSGPDDLELVSDSGEEEDNYNDDESQEGGPLDPRAGRVDVSLPTLPVPSTQLASVLRNALPTAAPTARRRATICLQRFEQLAKNEYPLRIKVATSEASEAVNARPARAARSLQRFETDLVTASDDLMLRGLSRKHRKRLLAKSRAGASIVEEVSALRATRSETSVATPNGDWIIEDETEKQKTHANNKNFLKNETSKKKGKKRKFSDKAERPINSKKQKTNRAVMKQETLDKYIVKRQNGEKEKQIKDVKLQNTIEEKQNISKDANKRQNIADNKQKIDNDVVKQQNSLEEKVKVSKDVVTRQSSLEEKQKIGKDVIKLQNGKEGKQKFNSKKGNKTKTELREPKFLPVKKIKRNEKKIAVENDLEKQKRFSLTPKRVKFELKKNSMQGPVDYYKSVRQSPSIPYDGTKQPSKTNLKPCLPTPINPFFKRKFKLKN